MAQNTANAVARISSSELAEGTTYTAKQIDLIREQIMPTASDDELMLFAQVSSARGLDPFRKHIYAVSRRAQVNGQWVDKWSYQVSIDGLRLIAQRSGRYEGQTPAEWCGPDGVWTDVWLKKEPPAAARVGVYIKGNRAPLYSIALWSTFVQLKSDGTPTKFWNDMGPHMLAKCAEAQSLRKGFPEECGGLYTSEEMAQASNPPRGEVIDVEAPAQRGAPIRATVSEVVQDPERQKNAADLWNLANGTFRWDQETLDLVALDKMHAHLKDLTAQQLKELYMELVGTSAEEREEIIRIVMTPEEGEAKAS